MAYINKQTFEILEQPEEHKLDNYFECDEMIAPIISLLNKKGYTTRFCCEGHLYDTAMSPEMKPLNEHELPSEDNVCGYISHEIIDGSEYLYKVHIRRGVSEGYIAFEQYVNIEPFLDNFPEENVYASYGNNIIRWEYIETENKSFREERRAEIVLQQTPFEFFTFKVNYLSDIYEWVKGLPEYEDVISELNKKNRIFLLSELSKVKDALEKEIVCDSDVREFLDVYINNISVVRSKREEYNKMLFLELDGKIKFFHKVLEDSIIDYEGMKVLAITSSI